MSCKECIIGIINHQEYYELATVEELKQHIEHIRSFNEYLDGGLGMWRYNEWTWKQYCDKRVNTDLTRFDHCPNCGKKVDWRKLKYEYALR